MSATWPIPMACQSMGLGTWDAWTSRCLMDSKPFIVRSRCSFTRLTTHLSGELARCSRIQKEKYVLEKCRTGKGEAWNCSCPWSGISEQVAEERVQILASRRMPWLNSANNQSSKRKDFKKEKQQNKKKSNRSRIQKKKSDLVKACWCGNFCPFDHSPKAKATQTASTEFRCVLPAKAGPWSGVVEWTSSKQSAPHAPLLPLLQHGFPRRLRPQAHGPGTGRSFVKQYTLRSKKTKKST